MSVWKRVRSLFVTGEEDAPPAPDDPDGDEGDEGDEAREGFAPDGADPGAPSAAVDPLDREAATLLALSQRAEAGSADQTLAIDAFERLCEAGREVLAIDLARRVLATAPMPELRCRVAERLDARGDEETARELLERLVAIPDAPLDGWMLAAEIAERRGDARQALSLYEKIVSRDVDYPRARERVARLREKQALPRRDDGATLMAEGALSRGRYQLLRELGRGGAGTIFLADDKELGRRVALKVYHRRGRADRERLLQEARIAASLEHPGVIRVLDVDETLGAIAMEAIQHGSLRTWLSKGAIPADRLLPWASSAIDALGYVHARGVVHRDLKPSNMLLRTESRVVLTDFGIAQRPGETAAVVAGEGTRAYMPPEQLAGAPPHPSMDVHALGATLRELMGQLDGEPPAQLVEIAAACVRADPTARPALDRVAAAVRELARG